MKLITESLVALGLIATLGLVVVSNREETGLQTKASSVTEALTSLQEKTAFHTALRYAEQETGQPVSVMVDPAWFGEALPVNKLTDARRPWMDLAPPGDRSEHPPDPVLRDGVQAGFWYNPALGVFRARVPAQPTDQLTLELYNRVNTAELASVMHDPSFARQPLAYTPGVTPATSYASLRERSDRVEARVEKSALTKATPTWEHQGPAVSLDVALDAAREAARLQAEANSQSTAEHSGNQTLPSDASNPNAGATPTLHDLQR